MTIFLFVFAITFLWGQVIPVVFMAMDVRWGKRRDWKYYWLGLTWPTWVIPMFIYWIIVSTPEMQSSMAVKPKQNNR